MPNLIIDVAADGQKSKYPAHGWAKNSQGVKLLWFPLLRLIYEMPQIRKGITELPVGVNLVHSGPLRNSVHSLMIALRELARLLAAARPVEGEESDEQFFAKLELQSLGPLFIDLILVYLRRMPDKIVYYTRPLFFAKHGSVPHSFKAVRDLVVAGDSLERFVPLRDIADFRKAFESSEWFDLLSTEGHQGLRDSVEHFRHIDTQFQWTVKGGRECNPEVFLVRVESHGRAQFDSRELIASIRSVVSGLCQFCTLLSLGLSGERNEYWQGSMLPPLWSGGKDDDLTFFWPEIGESTEESSLPT